MSTNELTPEFRKYALIFLGKLLVLSFVGVVGAVVSGIIQEYGATHSLAAFGVGAFFCILFDLCTPLFKPRKTPLPGASAARRVQGRRVPGHTTTYHGRPVHSSGRRTGTSSHRAACVLSMRRSPAAFCPMSASHRRRGRRARVPLQRASEGATRTTTLGRRVSSAPRASR